MELLFSASNHFYSHAIVLYFLVYRLGMHVTISLFSIVYSFLLNEKYNFFALSPIELDSIKCKLHKYLCLRLGDI